MAAVALALLLLYDSFSLACLASYFASQMFLYDILPSVATNLLYFQCKSSPDYTVYKQVDVVLLLNQAPCS